MAGFGCKTEVVFNKLPALSAIVEAGAKAAVLAGANAALADMRHQLTEETKSGVKYPSLPNVSSAPGEAPQDQHHSLINTIPETAEVYDGPFGLAVAEAPAGDGSGEAERMEFGTSKIQPRPFVGPAAVVGGEAMAEAMEGVGEEIKSL